MGDGKTEFVVWAPFRKEVAVKLVSPSERIVPMTKDESGYWKATVETASPGTQYYYSLGGGLERPDPASHYQPQGIHKQSEVVDHGSFKWGDGKWPGIPLKEMIIYEIHLGTFTPEGNFDAAASRIGELSELGVNAVELMPVAQFPGERNWGYDGVHPFAVQNSYGGPDAMKRFVDACHRKGIAVILDVVYNHLGPEGDYLRDFGPYFTKKYKTIWGDAVNFDGPDNDGVRNFFIENAIFWLREYHVDALRLDAVHAIFDSSAKPFLLELSEKVKEFSESAGRKFYLMAENDLNEVKTVLPGKLGGFGMDAQFCEDFHHSLHTLLTGESTGYYVDFGKVGDMVKAVGEGFVYSGQLSRYRGKRHGSLSKGVPGEKFVVFSQNHDQVGNRMLGERLTNLVSFEALKLAAGAVFLSPYIPFIFMGEEYGEETPFLYFVSHLDPKLVEEVREGRKSEFHGFRWRGEPPDPQSEDTFLRSKLDWESRKEGKHGVLLSFYRRLTELRKKIPSLSNLDKTKLEVAGVEERKLVFLRRWEGGNNIFCAMNFSRVPEGFDPEIPGNWRKVLDSSGEEWEGPGSIAPGDLTQGQKISINPSSFVLYEEVAK